MKDMQLPRIDDPRFLFFTRERQSLPHASRVVEFDYTVTQQDGLIVALAKVLGEKVQGVGQAIDYIEDVSQAVDGLNVHITDIPYSNDIFLLTELIDQIQLVAYVFHRQALTVRFYLIFNFG